jgi:glycosyltransferase involved in cell wall biosynthesis
MTTPSAPQRPQETESILAPAAGAGQIVLLNICETRTWNFIHELERRGFQTVEFKTGNWKDFVFGLVPFCRAVRRSAFVFCGLNLPWQLPSMILVKLIGRKSVLDCPMDVAAWPFPEKAHWKWMVTRALRLSGLVLTIRTRAYMAAKFGLRGEQMAYVESCPNSDLVLAGLRATPRFQPPAESFTVCISGGHEPHRLERFLPIFEALIPLVPNIELLLISDPSKPLVRLITEYARRAGFHQRLRVLPVIKPPEEFFATVARCQLWVAMLGDDTLQGKHEFRMELMEIGLLGKPAVVTLETPGLAEHNFTDGKDLLYVDLADPAGTAAKIAAFANRPGALERLSLNLQQRVSKDYSLTDAVDTIVGRV